MNNERKNTNIKWYSKNIYVDIETGEIITKSLYEREYYKVRTTKKTNLTNEYYGEITYTTECRRNGQQKMW